MQKILVTGASGYIGGRLVEDLIDLKLHVVSMVRRPEQFKNQFPKQHEVRYGNTLEPESLDKALQGIDIAFYLIHSLTHDKDFEKLEIDSARNFVESAKKNGVKKIIYLGGLFNTHRPLSRHLASRKEVGNIFRTSPIPSISFRASIIIGSGSLSFELIRNLTERLPIMITPKWVRVKAQPIGISDVLKYLKEAISLKISDHEIFEIGGVDQVSYSDIMMEYAKQRNLRRLIIPVPVLTPYLSSLWLSVFTPIYASIGRKLVNSIKIPTIVTQQDKTFKAFPFKPISLSQAVSKAIEREDSEFRRTHWASSFSSSNHDMGWLEQQRGNKLVYTKKLSILKSAKSSFHVIQQIGGKKGWYYGNFIWKLRGFIDVLFGGTGYRRGRKHPVNINEGDFLDWWRVEQFSPPSCLRLFAEMKLPGKAWLEFELKSTSDHSCDLYLSAIFDPSGLFGRLYWYSLYPVHFFIFNGLLNGLKKEIELN
ncbi:DUF2867 domain-containing protein [Candidatus Marinamargulisbacteria bacterium SCGC AG-343-D04]|nr:DUF2867 domain-containing protein [Candidatus Marinamargulisbacteria bacterium SCGC AG-343-D04]